VHRPRPSVRLRLRFVGLGALLGRRASAKKTEAARPSGLKGGRSRKAVTTELMPVGQEASRRAAHQALLAALRQVYRDPGVVVELRDWLVPAH
jgi:hypothetical protein